jgi:hypothetical protein
LYRKTADDLPARLQQLARLSETFGVEPDCRARLSGFLRQPPSRVTDQLFAWKWRLRRADVLPLARRSGSIPHS